MVHSSMAPAGTNAAPFCDSLPGVSGPAAVTTSASTPPAKIACVSAAVRRMPVLGSDAYVKPALSSFSAAVIGVWPSAAIEAVSALAMSLKSLLTAAELIGVFGTNAGSGRL